MSKTEGQTNTISKNYKTGDQLINKHTNKTDKPNENQKNKTKTKKQNGRN